MVNIYARVCAAEFYDPWCLRGQKFAALKGILIETMLIYTCNINPVGFTILMYLGRRLKCTIVISVILPPSVVVNFSHGSTSLKPLNLTGSKVSTSSTKFVFFVQINEQDGRTGTWFADTFLTSLKLLNEIQRHFTGSKMSTSSTKFVFIGQIGKTRSPPKPPIDWDIFDFSETAEQNSRKQRF